MVEPFYFIIMLFNFKGTFNYGLDNFYYKKLIWTKYEKKIEENYFIKSL